jgi:uncharacterized MAPEG superfamily protein
MSLSQWALLGFAAWTVLLVVTTIGYTRVSAVLRGEARANSFNAAVPHGSEGYQRCMRAHVNCVENLPVFATLVLLGAATGLDSSLFETAALCVLPARLGQSIAHIASGRSRVVLVRFGFFCVQLTCFAVMTALLVQRGLDAQQP